MKEASTQLYPPGKKSPRKDTRSREARSRDVPLFNGAEKEHGRCRRLGVLGNRLMTFTNTVSLAEVPTRVEVALL